MQPRSVERPRGRSFRVRKGRTGTVRVTLSMRVSAALHRRGVKTVRISVRNRTGVTTRTLRLRR